MSLRERFVRRGSGVLSIVLGRDNKDGQVSIVEVSIAKNVESRSVGNTAILRCIRGDAVS